MGDRGTSARRREPAQTPVTHVGAAVIGAGPAGAVAAATLARKGLRVALIDPGPRGGPVIGETLPAAAAQILARHRLPGPLDDPGHAPIGGALSIWDGPPISETALNRPGGPDWRLDRAAFDAALKKAAGAAGAELIADRAQSVHRAGAAWDVILDGGRMTADALIDATGRRRLVSRAHGGPRQQQERQIAVWAIGSPAPPPRTNWTLIQATVAGWWYGAFLPSGQPIAAYHCTVEEALSLRRAPEGWQARLKDADILSSRLDPAGFADAPLQFADASGAAATRPAGPGWAACGDAAIAFDPIAAQGLLNAIRTGVAAAASITGGQAAQDSYCAEMRAVWSQYLARHRALYARRGTAARDVC